MSTPADAYGLDELDAVRAVAEACTACPLYERATQTVFGEGDPSARLVLVGEQPGDKEDLAGAPFVGPAGRLLDKALAEAGVDRRDAYVTNVVKHFKWRPAGKVRLHQKPNAAEIAACRPWLHHEMARLHADVVVCLGATAAQALLGRSFRVTQQRGQWAEWDHDPGITATVHPSAVLRTDDGPARQAAFDGLVSDLAFAATGLRARQ